MNPLVSVVIPTYNRADLVVRAIESVRGQTYGPLQIVVVDDGSTDNTPSVLAALARQEPRLVCCRHETNLGKRSKGGQAARNTGIRAASGEFIAFLDSDDEFLPRKIERQMPLFSDPEVGVVHCGAFQTSGGSDPRRDYRVPKIRGDVRKPLLSGPPLPFPGFVVRKTCLERIGYLDEDIRSFQEWDTAIRLAGVCRFGFVDEPLFVIHSWRSEAPGEWVRGVQGFLQVVRKHRAQIIRVCGRRTLAAHFKHASIWAFAGGQGDAGLMRRTLYEAFLANPADPRPLAHLVLSLAGLGVYARLYGRLKGAPIDQDQGRVP